MRSVATEAEKVARPSSEGISLELRSIAEHRAVVEASLRARRASDDIVASVEALATLNAAKNAKAKERDEALATRKQISGAVGKLMKTNYKKKMAPTDSEEEAALKKLKEAASEAGALAAACESELETMESECGILFARLPNLIDDRVPDGASEAENVVVKEWGLDLCKIEGDWAWHDDLAAKLGGYDAEAAAKISGARFAVLRGGVARLERALANFFLDSHTSAEGGYEEVAAPLIVARSALEGTGQLPKFEEDLFKIANHAANGEDAFLIPTAEVPLTNLVSGRLLEEADLPLHFAAWTQCFRAEAGSYGRDTRGLIRQHQFGKVELVKVVAPAEAAAAHEALVRDAERCLEALELPYRTVLLCSGDMGFSARLCYDLEVWLPGQQAWREISSCSSMGDFQAKRMGLRYRPQPTPNDKKPRPVAPVTMNGSGLAVGRALVAVLENHQRPDGSVAIPKALQPYMGGQTELVPPPAPKGKKSE